MARFCTFLPVLAACSFAAVATGMGGHAPRKTDAAGLSWYDRITDALVEAKKSGKPVLLLSMFGRLDEAMPCANARTLRATLFKDPGFQSLAHNEVVLAWETVRPVPKVTIDLGDGKKLTRTVRGNAVMYLCNTDGKVVDAYPGVYTAADFLPMVRESIARLATSDTASVLAYHRERGATPIPARITTGKAMLESPTLDLVGAKAVNGASTAENTTDPARLAFLRAARGLRDLSLSPMTPEETVASITGKPLAGRDPKEVAREILEADSRKNMTAVRPVVHLWMASEKGLPTPAEARDAVLETILKIPYKDPYFGLKDVLLPGTPD